MATTKTTTRLGKNLEMRRGSNIVRADRTGGSLEGKSPAHGSNHSQRYGGDRGVVLPDRPQHRRSTWPILDEAIVREPISEVAAQLHVLPRALRRQRSEEDERKEHPPPARLDV